MPAGQGTSANNQSQEEYSVMNLDDFLEENGFKSDEMCCICGGGSTAWKVSTQGPFECWTTQDIPRASNCFSNFALTILQYKTLITH